MTRADVFALKERLYEEFQRSEFPERGDLLLSAFHAAQMLHTILGRIEFFDEQNAKKLREENEKSFVEIFTSIGRSAA